MTTEPPSPANGDEDPWTDLFGASLALDKAGSLAEIAEVLGSAHRAFPEPVDKSPEAFPIYAVGQLLSALLGAIGRLPK